MFDKRSESKRYIVSLLIYIINTVYTTVKKPTYCATLERVQKVVLNILVTKGRSKKYLDILIPGARSLPLWRQVPDFGRR